MRAAIPAVLLAGVLALAGCGPAPSDPAASDPAPAGEVWFREAAREQGLVFDHVSGHAEPPLMAPEIMGGGAALFDMDEDGDLDAYLVQSGSLIDAPGSGPTNRLFRNRGDGSFEDATEGSGAADRGFGMGVAAGDYDNDGDVDLYVLNVGPNVLLRNEGDGRFADVTSTAGVGHPGYGSSAAFLDYDLDGDLDLYALNYFHWSVENEVECFNPLGQLDFCSPKAYRSPAMDTLYRNDGDGTFVDVSKAVGLDAGFGNGLGLAVGDYDGNGWLDVFVANDATLDQLWSNQEGRRFVDAGLVAGVAADREGLAKAGMGVATGTWTTTGTWT